MKKISLILAGILFSCSLQAVNTESNTETGVESDQIQMRKPAKKVIKKSIERTEGEIIMSSYDINTKETTTERAEDKILIKEYDEQGNLIKITKQDCSDCDKYEFNLKDGKVLSAKGSLKGWPQPKVDKQKNIAIFDKNDIITFEFCKHGIKEYVLQYVDARQGISYEYNEEGLLVKEVEIWQDYIEDSTNKTATTYTYDVMNQNWKKRTATDNQGNETVTTRTVEYW